MCVWFRLRPLPALQRSRAISDGNAATLPGVHVTPCARPTARTLRTFFSAQVRPTSSQDPSAQVRRPCPYAAKSNTNRRVHGPNCASVCAAFHGRVLQNSPRGLRAVCGASSRAWLRNQIQSVALPLQTVRSLRRVPVLTWVAYARFYARF
eukprot:2534911-Rhodomonas_salina.1